jgi:hypothetical protein
MKDKQSWHSIEATCEGPCSDMYVTKVCTEVTTFSVKKGFVHKARKWEALNTSTTRKKEKRQQCPCETCK